MPEKLIPEDDVVKTTNVFIIIRNNITIYPLNTKYPLRQKYSDDKSVVKYNIN